MSGTISNFSRALRQAADSPPQVGSRRVQPILTTGAVIACIWLSACSRPSDGAGTDGAATKRVAQTPALTESTSNGTTSTASPTVGADVCPDPALIAEAAKVPFDTLTKTGDYPAETGRVGICNYLITQAESTYDPVTGANHVAIESGGLPLAAEATGLVGAMSWVIEPLPEFASGAKIGRATGAMGTLTCRISFESATTVLRVAVSGEKQKSGEMEGLCRQAQAIAQAIR